MRTAMTDFEWSPEAIEAADIAVSEGMAVGDVNLGRDAIYAAVKAQPVVALPPCPTCKGEGDEERYRTKCPVSVCNNGWCGYSGDEMCQTCQGEGEVSVRRACHVCNGSGVERLVPVSEIVAWLRDRARQSPYSWGQRVDVAAQIERKFK